LVDAVSTRSTAITGKPLAGLFFGVAMLLVVQSGLVWWLTGSFAYTNRPLGPIEYGAYVVGLPLLLVLASIGFLLRGDRPLPPTATFMSLLGCVALLGVVLIGICDTTAAGPYLQMLILVGAGYQLRPLGAWIVTILIVIATGVTSWVLSTPLLAARTTTVTATVALVACWLLVQARQTHENTLIAHRREARTDALTGAATRLALDEWLVEVTGRPGRGVGFVLVDVDGFKQINDRHGHHVGDRVLQRVSSVLLDLARPGDIVARLGGDEFAVASVHVDENETQRSAASVAEALAGPAQGLPAIAASMGVAYLPMADVIEGGLDALMSAADARMYAGKSRRTMSQPVSGPGGSVPAPGPRQCQ
jgi:diguanylate cyclase (GGDEF)-like protein